MKDAWWLVWRELRFQRNAVIATLFVTLFSALIAAAFFGTAITDSQNVRFTAYFPNYFLDMTFLLVIPNFTTIYIAEYYMNFHSIKEDPLSKQMALYRSLPISMETLTMSRVFKALFLFTVQSFIFYGAFMMVLSLLGMDSFAMQDFLLFVLFWLGGGLILGSFIPCVEFGLSIRVIFVVCFIWLLFFLSIHLIVYALFDVGIVFITWKMVPQYGLYLSVASLILGSVSCYLWFRWLHQRLQRRDYV